MAAVVIEDAALVAVAAVQATLRSELGRRPGDALHWQNIRSHQQRLHAAKSLAAMPAVISSVVVCKRHLGPADLPDEHTAYLFTFRFLLERLSWFARDNGATLSTTLAAITRFPLGRLRQYESRLQGGVTKIEWAYLDPHGCRIDQPNRVEQLQLADLAVSAIATAFEPDQFGNREPRYVHEFAPRLYRRPSGLLTSYGLKIHPWSEAVKATYPWVAAL